MKTILTVLCLVSWSNGLHGTTTEAFQHGGSPVRSLTATTTATTTSLLAAISPDGGFRKTINGKTSPARVNNKITMKKTKKNNSKSANDGLRIKRDEVVLEPYYGIANGILLAAPILLLQHTCKCITRTVIAHQKRTTITARHIHRTRHLTFLFVETHNTMK